MSKLSFNDMLEQNYTFFSSASDVLAVVGSDEYQDQELVHIPPKAGPLNQKAVVITRQEQLLGSRVRPTPFQDWSEDLGQHLLLHVGEEQKTVLVDDSVTRNRCASIMKKLGHNNVVGQERFFHLPFFWAFEVEKSQLLLDMLEHLKSGGIAQYFMRQHDSMEIREDLREIRQELIQTTGTTAESDEGVGLADNVISEGFMLLALRPVSVW